MVKKLDGAGTAKMSTLQDAQVVAQRLHGIIEQMALSVKKEQPTTVLGMQLRRAGMPIVGTLKGHFTAMSDLVAHMNLVATRSGNDAAKVRSLRESVASLKTQLDIAMTKVKEQHLSDDDAAESTPSE
jgi:hypothetical protein